jgi:nitrate/nitrite transporter NarK
VQLGGGTSVYLLPVLARAVGWRAAFVLSSALVAATLLVWILAAPDARTTSPGTAGFAGAVRSGTAWRLGAAHAGSFGLAVLIGTWVTTFLVHDVNATLVTAGAAGSVVLALGLLARPLGGLVLERGVLSTRAMVMLSFGITALALGVVSLPHPSLGVTTVALAAIGVAANMPYAAVMNAAVVAGAGSPGATVGLTSAVAILFLALAVPLVGALYQATGSFGPAFAGLGVLCAVAGWNMRAIDDDEPSR